MATLPTRADAARALVEAGRRFYARGWVLGTSGNFSAVVADDPLRLLVTPSGAHKGTLDPNALVEVDGDGRLVAGEGRSSAETLLHLEIARARGARAVLHTHSVWVTILSDRHARAGGLAIWGYEMLKGLEGVATHDHREWVPIVTNDQDMTRLAGSFRSAFERHPDAHAVLIAGHGLYTWGGTIAAAERHVEILEFLLEVLGRTAEGRHGAGENPR